MSSTTNPDELQPASARPVGERVSEPPPTDPQRPTICPRCGGEAQPRRRRPGRLNPFLAGTPPKPQVTCVDCGLDLELKDDGSPWGKGP